QWTRAGGSPGKRRHDAVQLLTAEAVSRRRCGAVGYRRLATAAGRHPQDSLGVLLPPPLTPLRHWGNSKRCPPDGAFSLCPLSSPPAPWAVGSWEGSAWQS